MVLFEDSVAEYLYGPVVIKKLEVEIEKLDPTRRTAKGNCFKRWLTVLFEDSVAEYLYGETLLELQFRLERLAVCTSTERAERPSQAVSLWSRLYDGMERTKFNP